jgi:hypothetical protein
MIFQLVSISITSATPSKLTPEIKPGNLSVLYHEIKTPTGEAGEFNLDPVDPFVHYFGTDAVYSIVITLTPDFTEGDKLNLKVTANSSAFTCQVRVEKTLNAYAYVVFRGGRWQVINLEDFYQVALEWSAPYAAEPKPKLFSLGAWNIANPIVAFGSETLSKPSFKSELEALLVSLCRTAANLGLNTAILDGWSPNDSDACLTSAKVNQTADAAGIRKRIAADVEPIPHPLRQGGRKSEEPTYPSDFVFDLVSAHTNADGTVAYDLYFGGLYYTGMLTQALDARQLPSVPPRSPLQTRVQEAISYIQNNLALDAAELPALERINLYDEPSIDLQNLAPEFRETPAFVRCLDYASTAQLPDTGPLQFLKRCFQDQGQLAGSLYEGLAIEIGLFRQAYLTYLKMVNSSPLFFGFSNWDLVSPPAAFLAGDVPVQRAGDAASRRLHYWTLRFMHAQISEGWAAQSIALNKQLKSLGHPTGCYSHCTSNARFGCTHLIAGAPPQPAGPMTEPTADSRYSCLYADWFSDSRANLALRAQGFKEFLVQPEDDDTSGYLLHHATAKAALLRSASLVGTEAGTSFLIKARVLGLNPDELVYRALAFIGNGAKSINYFNFQGSPAQDDHWIFAKACYSQIATTSRILANAEPVLYAAKPVLSRVAIVISSSSDIVAIPGENASGNCGYPAYAAERFDLHVALSRQGFQVDFLDETALIEGRLAQYSVVYLTDPVLVAHPAPGDPRPSTYEQLATWVANGGQLVFGAGAAVINEIGEPIGTPIDQLTGVDARLDVLEIVADAGGISRSVRPVKREWWDQDEHPPAEVTIELLVGPDSTHPTAVFSTVLGNDGEPLPLIKPLLSPDHEPYCPLTISSSAATVLARLVVPASEEAPKKVIGNAIVRHRYGNGQVYSYSFFPGRQYVATGSNLWVPSAAPNVGEKPIAGSVFPFPSGFATSAGELAALPVAAFGLQPLVEVMKLIKQPGKFRSEIISTPTQVQANALVNGPSMAIVLLNWNRVNADGYRLFIDPINLSISYWVNNEQLTARGFLVKSARTGQVLRYTVKRQNMFFSRFTFTLPGFTTADIVTIEPIRRQMPRIPRLPLAGPWQRIGGDGGGDGGSTWIGPKGRILKVPPRQPLVRWLEEVLNLRVFSSLRARTGKGFLARLFANR